MNPQRFANQINRLAKQFSSAFSEERVKLIWREVGQLSDEWFETLVDRFIGDLRQAPLLPDFREAASIERDRLWEIEKKTQKEHSVELSPTFRCSYCKDRGVYVCIHNRERALYAFRCHCERGMSDPRVAIPQYKPAHLPDFTWVDAPLRGIGL